MGLNTDSTRPPWEQSINPEQFRNVASEPDKTIFPNLFNAFYRRANHFRFSELMSSPGIKNILLPLFRNNRYIPGVSSSQRGAYRDRQYVGVGCGGRDARARRTRG